MPYSEPPRWIDGGPPALNATNLNVMSENQRTHELRMLALENGGPSTGGSGLENFATISALRSASSSGRTSGSLVYVRTHTNAGDQGHGMFEWDASSAVPENNGTVVKPLSVSGNGRWLRQFDGPINVRWFGAGPANIVDNSSPAFQAANDAAKIHKSALYIPALPDQGYRLRQTVNTTVRHIFGDASDLDAGNPGTLISFQPASPTDLMAAFDIVGGMYGQGHVEDVAVVGGHSNFSLHQLGSVINAAQLPNYGAFPVGVCGFRVRDGNNPVFSRCRTSNVKAGLVCSSHGGHITSYDSNWSGLFGVYIDKNGGDFFFQGGGLSGSWCGLLLGTTESGVGKMGGADGLTMKRVHMGFGPYAIYQCVTTATGTPMGMSASFLSDVRFEAIGECAIQMLDNAIMDKFFVDSLASTWSGMWTNYPTSQGSEWSYNLPPQIIPYANQRSYMARLGSMSHSQLLNFHSGADSYTFTKDTRSSGAKGSVYVHRMGSGCDLRGVDQRDVVINQKVDADARTFDPGSTLHYGAQVAHLHEIGTPSSVLVGGNILRNPETTSNWINRGANISIAVQRARAASVPISTEVASALGSNPMLVTVQNTGAGTQSLELQSIGAPSTLVSPLYYSYWFYSSSSGVVVISSAEFANFQTKDRFHFSTTAGKWKRVRTSYWPNPNSSLFGLKIQIGGGSMVHFGGIYAGYNPRSGYTPASVPAVVGGLALVDVASTTSATAGAASALPGAPQGYITVNINGTDRKIPYYA